MSRVVKLGFKRGWVNKGMVLLAVLLLSSTAMAAGSISIPNLGVPAPEATETGSCASIDGEFSATFYDFDPADDARWRTIAFGPAGKRPSVVITADAPGGTYTVYLDGDSDGKAESSYTKEQFLADPRFEGIQFCDLHALAALAAKIMNAGGGPRQEPKPEDPKGGDK